MSHGSPQGPLTEELVAAMKPRKRPAEPTADASAAKKRGKPTTDDSAVTDAKPAAGKKRRRVNTGIPKDMRLKMDSNKHKTAYHPCVRRISRPTVRPPLMLQSVLALSATSVM